VATRFILMSPQPPEYVNRADDAEILRPAPVTNTTSDRARNLSKRPFAAGRPSRLAYAPSAMISRPISQRRISLVPAPIS